MILGIIKRVFAPVAVGCLLYFAWDTRESLLDIVSDTDALRLLAAVVAWSLMHAMSPVLSTLVYRSRGNTLAYRTAATIHITNLPAKYVPGGIWHTVGRIASFRRLGISKLDIAVFVFLENALAVGVAFVIGGVSVAWYQNMEPWSTVAGFAAAGGLILLTATPHLLSVCVVKGDLRFRTGEYLAGIAVVAVSWCVGAGAFVLYVTAFPGIPLQASPLETAGAYLFSWGVGFVSIFAPQGIGVFEIVAADLMRATASLKSTAALLAGFRLVILMSDALSWIAMQALSRGVRPGQSTAI